MVTTAKNSSGGLWDSSRPISEDLFLPRINETAIIAVGITHPRDGLRIDLKISAVNTDVAEPSANPIVK